MNNKVLLGNQQHGPKTKLELFYAFFFVFLLPSLLVLFIWCDINCLSVKKKPSNFVVAVLQNSSSNDVQKQLQWAFQNFCCFFCPSKVSIYIFKKKKKKRRKDFFFYYQNISICFFFMFLRIWVFVDI